jgi:hypothetical protein
MKLIIINFAKDKVRFYHRYTKRDDTLLIKIESWEDYKKRKKENAK